MVHGEVVGLMNGELVMGGILEGDKDLVADRSEAGRRPVTDLLARAIDQILARCRSATSIGPVCNQDSVIEFGLYRPLLV